MYFRSTIAAAAGAALFSVTSASPVCRLKSSNSNNGGWQPAVVPQGPSTQNQGGWQNMGWQNLDGNTIIIRTTTLSHGSCNPTATGAPQWATYGSSPSSSAPSYSLSAVPTGGQSWVGWATLTTTTGGVVGPTGISTSTTTTTGGVIVSPTGLPTTTTSSGVTVSPTSLSTITTAPTNTTSSTTTTTTTTTSTTSPACPNAPTGIFYLQATNAANAALEGRYAGLANNGFGNLVAFSETDLANAVQVTFDVDCSLISAVGPLVILDDPTITPAATSHYQYMNEEGTQAGGVVRSIDTCSADANNVLSCTVNGESILQTSTDIMTIGETLEFDAVTIVLIPA